MPSANGKVSERALAIAQQGNAVFKPSKLPPLVRFPLLVLLSLTLSTMLFSFTSDYTADLASVSRSLDQWWEVGAIVGWRTWLYLLGTFYDVGPVPILLTLSIDVSSKYIPFRLLRSLSLAHSTSDMRHAANVPNKEILTSTSIQVYTTLLASGIYSVALFTAYVSFLPVYLVTYFTNIKTIAAAHSATPITLFPETIILGLAAKAFIFSPAVATVPSKKATLNPETATLLETFLDNVWGYEKRTKVVVQRTVTLMLVSGMNTFVETFVAIEGVEARGAIVFAGVWVVANGMAGTTLGWVAGAV